MYYQNPSETFILEGYTSRILQKNIFSEGSDPKNLKKTSDLQIYPSPRSNVHVDRIPWEGNPPRHLDTHGKAS